MPRDIYFTTTGTQTLEDQILAYMHRRQGQKLSTLECAAYAFHTTSPGEVHMRETEAALGRLIEMGRIRIAP